MYQKEIYKAAHDEVIDPTMIQKEEAYQVILDIIKNSACYNAFLTMVDVPEIYMQQFWNTVKKVKKLQFYEFDLADKKLKFVITGEDFQEYGRAILDTMLTEEINQSKAYKGSKNNSDKSDEEVGDKEIEWLTSDEEEENQEDDDNDKRINIERLLMKKKHRGEQALDDKVEDNQGGAFAFVTHKQKRSLLGFGVGVGVGGFGGDASTSSSGVVRTARLSCWIRISTIESLAVLTTPLLDVLASPPKPPTPTPTPKPFTTPLPTPTISHEATIVPVSAPEALSYVLQKLYAFKKDETEFKPAYHFKAFLASIRSQVPSVVKKKQAAKDEMPKYSKTPYDQKANDEHKQKDALFKMTMASKSYERHPAHKATSNNLQGPTLDPEWNTGKIVDDEPEQSWFNELVHAEKPSLTFNEFMATPTDSSYFAMNRINLEKITKVNLIGPVYNLLQGTCDGYQYDLSKPLPLKDHPGHLTVPVERFFNNDLEYLKSGTEERKYTDGKAIGSKWIFKIKYKSSGKIDRYKATLVAQGFGQKEGIDYKETFSPIVKMVIVRCLLNVVVSDSWPVFQLDMNNTLWLKKFLYGLKQAPIQWNATLTSLKMVLVKVNLTISYILSLRVEPDLIFRIKEAQKEDSEIWTIVENLDKQVEFCLDDDNVLWQDTRLVVPNDASLREAPLTEAHSSLFSVHPGSTKMYHDRKQHFWWSGMKRDVA
nr:ribonuclease H-like domain-containing protein [Tanacetum cinerariifolium]